MVPGNAWFSKSIYCQDKQENSQCRWISCVIHCEALASGTLFAALKDNLAIIIRTVKFVKKMLSIRDCLPCFAKTWIPIVRLCCFIHLFGSYQKGTLLARMYEMREELKLFLEAHTKQDLLHSFTTEGFKLQLAYRVHIFQALHNLNVLLHG